MKKLKRRSSEVLPFSCRSLTKRDKAKVDTRSYKHARKACHRGDLFVFSKDSYFYIYSLHIVGGNGPVKEDPDPISAVASKERVILSICAFITLTEVIFEVIFYTVLGYRG